MMRFLLPALAITVTAGFAAAGEMSLWYSKSADPAKWEQALPLGSGKLGAMIFGGIDKDRMILNEDSLWSGWPEPKNDREGSYEALVKIRKLLKAKGDLKQANKIAMQEFCSLYGYGKPDFGAYHRLCFCRHCLPSGRRAALRGSARAAGS